MVLIATICESRTYIFIETHQFYKCLRNTPQRAPLHCTYLGEGVITVYDPFSWDCRKRAQFHSIWKNLSSIL